MEPSFKQAYELTSKQPLSSIPSLGELKEWITLNYISTLGPDDLA